ncbi:hypothetical protein BGZ73_006592 [Actinomortierella ambigua]|nr:hypothetical protein BGZ73_006592 [Actinomortierella ambigua]
MSLDPHWVEITDPESQNTFYANLSSGECDWCLPEGVTIHPGSPAGDWWELFDDIHNLPYYYNTKTGQTEWERPHDGRQIISLIAIQKSVIGQRLSTHLSSVSGKRDTEGTTKGDKSNQQQLSGHNSIPGSPVQSTGFQSNPASPISSSFLDKTSVDLPFTSCTSWGRATSSEAQSQNGSRSPPNSFSKGTSLSQQALKESQRGKSKSQYGISSAFVSSFQRAASMTLHRNSAQMSQPIPIPSSPPASGGNGSVLLSSSHPPTFGSYGSTSPSAMDDAFQPARKSFQIAERARKFGIGSPVMNDDAARKMSPMIMEQQQEALRKLATSPPPASRGQPENGGDHSRCPSGTQPTIQLLAPISGEFSTRPPHPALPADLQSSISQFRIAGFAQKYFATHKKGIFRRKVPVEKMLLHQKSPLTQPLMVLNKRSVQKDALRCFKLIQKLMGERKGNGYTGATNVALGETCADLSIRSEEDIKWLLELIKKGLDFGELRDEIYVQLCKQLTENPSREGSIKGWHLFTILLITFAPSKNLHDYLASFLNQHVSSSPHPIPTIAQHCNELLRRISKRGARAKLLTVNEIARAQEAAFRPSVFEQTLERLMSRQMAEGGEWSLWRVPRLMVFLKESVEQLGGLRTEGIFRISGDLGAVAELRARIELGNYDISGIEDPHVPCSLLRLWIRDLPEPAIPYDFYQRCIQCSQDSEEISKILEELPIWHKELIVYLVTFLKQFSCDTVRSKTKMNLSNLAMVFAPTLLQCPSDDTPMLMGHLQAERTFVSTLIDQVELTDEIQKVREASDEN